MWPIIERTIKDRKLVFLVYIVAASAFLFMHTSIFPSFKDQQVDISKMLESMPQGVIDAFGLKDYDLSIFENYITGEEFSLIWPLLLLIMSISFAGGAIASEIEKGTIEVLLSQPISRMKLYISRYLSGFILVLGFVVVTIGVLIALVKPFGVDPQYSHYPTLALGGALLGWAVYSIAMFLSSIFSDRGKVYFISAGILVLMYALNIVSSLKDSLENLKYLSFFHYYAPNDLLIRNHIDKMAIVVFVAVAIIFSLVGAIVFDRRDIAT